MVRPAVIIFSVRDATGTCVYPWNSQTDDFLIMNLGCLRDKVKKKVTDYALDTFNICIIMRPENRYSNSERKKPLYAILP